MKRLWTAVAASLLAMTGPANAALDTTTGISVEISAIPSGATHGTLMFTGLTGVKSVRVLSAPAGTTAKPLNAPSGKGFTLDFRPRVKRTASAYVCFTWTTPLLHPMKFRRGSWAFSPSNVVKPIAPGSVKVNDCFD